MVTRIVRLQNGTIMRLSAAMRESEDETRFALIAEVAVPTLKPDAGKRIVLRAPAAEPPALPLFAVLRGPTLPAIVPAPVPVVPEDPYHAPFLLGRIP